MDIRDVTLENLMNHMKRIDQILADPAQVEPYLNAARNDTPVVNDLLDAMAMMTQRGTSSPGSLGMQRAERDLLVILALREIQDEEKTETPRSERKRAN